MKATKKSEKDTSHKENAAPAVRAPVASKTVSGPAKRVPLASATGNKKAAVDKGRK